MEEHEMITEFINYQMQVRGLSPSTCFEYEKNLRAFASWARPQGLRWSTITKQDVDRHTIEERQRGIKPATIKMQVSVLRSFYKWLQHEGKMLVNPLQYVQSPKLEKHLPTPIEQQHIDHYLAEEPIDQMDRYCHLFVALCCDTGMRLHEAMNVEKADIDFTARTIRVRDGKGGKERIVYYSYRFTQELCKQLTNWTGGRLFGNIEDVAMRYAVYNYLGRWVVHAHPHRLRYTFAHEALNAGMPIETLSRILGHSSVQVTERYARLTQVSIENDYRKIYN